ncbi:MAG: 3-methyl-2-oxobutanoate hydroxymethyltransferase [Alphaproteobacteria bacterium]
MSAHDRNERTTVPEIAARKGGVPVVCLTAYTTPMAGFLDPHADLLLVGDSLGMVVYGLPDTLGVTLDMMIAHGAAVVRGSRRACVIIDMPFSSYQESPGIAFRNAARVMAETGAAGIKLEGGEVMAPTVRFLVDRGVPVLGHVGLMPQSVRAAGGFHARGRGEDDAARVMADAKAIAGAGAFAIVVEGTVEPVARAVTDAVAVPIIGIGASPACDGQILVTEDLVGLFTEFVPRHVKRYADLGAEIGVAAAAYAKDVRARRFPGSEHCLGARPRRALHDAS